MSAQGAPDIGRGVDRPTVFEYLKMHMGTGGATGIAHQSDGIALTDEIAYFHKIFAVVTITGHQAITVGHLAGLELDRKAWRQTRLFAEGALAPATSKAGLANAGTKEGEGLAVHECIIMHFTGA